MLDLAVMIRFKWRNPGTGEVEENVRVEKRTRKLGYGDDPQLPFAAGQMKGWGDELVNDLFPRVIEKELKQARCLR